MVSCGFNNENLIEMKIQIENLRAQMRGVQLNAYQRGLALDEYYKLLDYVDELEQLTIPAVVGRSEQLVCPNCDGEGFSGKGTNEILPCLSCFGSGERAD